MDFVALSIGTAVAKWVIRLWAPDSGFGDFSGDIASVIPRAVTETRQRRVAARQFDRLAEEVADRISPYLSAEISGVDEGELRAAAEGAQRALGSIALNNTAILDSDIDSAVLAQLIIRDDRENMLKQHLSEAGSAAYELILTEAVGYAVAVASRLPDFQTAALSELLSRETTLIDLASKVLSEQPESMVPETWGRGSAHQRFEARYRRSIYEHADRLQLFGVTSPTAKSTYSLSVAYIPLKMSPKVTPGDAATKNSNEEEDDEADAVRIEQALSGENRILISGGAGIGKTTLIQWLTLAAARSGFSGELTDWNGSIPFIIQLRRFNQGAFPPPEHFMRHTTPAISGASPQGWVHKVLEDGRALVLVDGFDEVSIDRRTEALSWLRDLNTTYPENRFVVTSRDNAIEESWQKEMRYARASLMPMEYPDIKEFVSHWHEAALGVTPSEHLRTSLELARRTVLAEIRDKASIRSLCTSPLLCALICALNQEGGARLPENRMEVYDAALQMLVVRRDRDRQVDVTDGVNLNFVESKLLLRGFAYWVHDNRASDASDENFRVVVADQLERLHHVKADSDIVSKHLLARSGVLREPVVGRVDFVHRTFLEYLAADAAVAANHIEKLVSLGHDDHWREVIIMAAGLAQLSNREELIRGLIARGDREISHRHVLYLLAVSCMETSAELTPDVQVELARCLRAVIPPSNMTDAAAIASAGDLAIPLLSAPPTYAVTAAASVRALGLIGGEGALSALKAYSSDSRLTVVRQVIRAWSAFDPQRYIHEVLVNSPLERGFLAVSDLEQIRLLGDLPNLRRARVVLSALAGGLEDIPRIPQITQIWANGLFELTSLGDLSGLGGVQDLQLMFATKLSSLEGIQTLETLIKLDIDGCSNITDLSPLSGLQNLEHLDIASTSVRSIEPLEHGPVLKYLRIANCERLETLGRAVHTRHLQLGECEALSDKSGIANSGALESLTLHGGQSAEPLCLPPDLKQLTVYGHRQSDHVDFSGASGLQVLTTRGISSKFDWMGFALQRPNLERMDMTWSERPDWDRAVEIASRPAMKFMSFSMAALEDAKELPQLDGYFKRLRGRIATYVKEKPLPDTIGISRIRHPASVM
jgi:hypothetical protein